MTGDQQSSAGGQRISRQLTRGVIASTTLVSLLALPLTAVADPTPTASATPTPTSSPTPTPSPSPSATPPGPGAAPEPPAGSSTPTPDPRTPTPAAEAIGAGPLSLGVRAAGSPVAGHFFEDVGSYAITGSAGAPRAGATVTIYRRTSAGTTWSRFGSAVVNASGGYAVSVPVQDRNTFVFRATAGSVASNDVTVRVEDSGVVLAKPVASVDSLKNPVVSGRVFPARPGVPVDIDLQRAGTYAVAAKTTSGSDGGFRVAVSYGNGTLATYRIRATYHAQNRDRTESTLSQTFTRAAVLNAVATKTTDDEVARTYHPGCPVGKSRLRTISMNFYGFDHRMHRGVLVVRSDLSTKITRGFASALAHRFPIAKMNNPNLYGGSDPKQMEANNTSGFNCRKVTGNPYAQSPHSYGIAVDVDTVYNPYRDVHGRWWPKNGKAYIKRTPWRPGMLTKKSYLTRSLGSDRFFWGGYWYPGRDYQHYQYRP